MRSADDRPGRAARPVSHPIRQRIRVGILGVTGLAVLLFAVPLALAVQRLYHGEIVTRMERDASRVAALVPDNPLGPGPAALTVPADFPGDTLVGLYTPAGDRAAGRGPTRSAVALAAADGRVHSGGEAGDLAVSVPVPSDRTVVSVVRAAVPEGVITGRVVRAWLAMVLLGAVVVGVGGVLARRQAVRIAVPLERLTASAAALGSGDFSIRAAPSGIGEVDAAAAALQETARRLGDLLERERAFTADASHQLRTPLAGLLLGLESTVDGLTANPGGDPLPPLRQAIERSSELLGTIEDLLELRRDTGVWRERIDLVAEIGQIRRRWEPHLAAHGRSLLTSVPTAPPPVRIAPAALRQILDVLLGNALDHGAGPVRLVVGETPGAVSIQVSDDGPGFAGDPREAFTRRSAGARGHGIGLALARSLAEAEGGRLVVRRPRPGAVLALLLPVAEPPPPRGSAPPSDSSPPTAAVRSPADGRAGPAQSPAS